MEDVKLAEISSKIATIKQHSSEIIVGQEKVVDLLLTAIIANGHVLLEGVPGIAKTLMAKVISKLIDADFSRLQFTPDLMPSDVLGTTVFNLKSGEFDFHRGPIFADLVLVDEINRAPAKTQSALFEVMEERQVTVDGTTYKMSDVYTILATQNPVEQEGTYKLPEAQLDRFLFKIKLGYPSLDEEIQVLTKHSNNIKFTSLEGVEPVLSKQDVIDLRNSLNEIFIEDSLVKYIVQIVQQTRSNKNVYLGASPRASIALLQASKAFAMIQGRGFVTPEDIKFVALPVLEHRMILTAEAEMEGLTPDKITQRLIDKVEVPK